MKRISGGEAMDLALRAARTDPLFNEWFFTTPLAMVVHSPQPRGMEAAKVGRPAHVVGPPTKHQKSGTGGQKGSGIGSGGPRKPRSPPTSTPRPRAERASATRTT